MFMSIDMLEMRLTALNPKFISTAAALAFTISGDLASGRNCKSRSRPIAYMEPAAPMIQRHVSTIRRLNILLLVAQ